MGIGNIENSLLPFSRIIFSILDPYFMKGAILCLLWRFVFRCWNSSLKNYQEKTLTTNRNSRVCNVPRDPPSSWFCTLKTLQGMESVLWWSMHTNYSLRSALTLPTLSTCSQPQSKCLHCRVGKRVLKTLRSSIWKKLWPRSLILRKDILRKILFCYPHRPVSPLILLDGVFQEKGDGNFFLNTPE